MTVVVGTAGHIDHGKTSLLRALTGIDADRLPEERRRGMTIDVGYAHMLLPDGRAVDFVDVPGHDGLVGNMLVGAGEIDAALLVVAADDGPRAQTLEHLELLDGLGIPIGVAAVTKVDAVEPGRAEEVAEAVRSLLAPTTLAGSPVVPVSSIRGDGLDALRQALAGVVDRVAEASSGWPAGAGGVPGEPGGAPGQPGGARLAIDRVFTVRGRGLVVTGSLRGGPVSRGDLLRLEPGGRSVRARELQVHGTTVGTVAEGGRVAINLAGDLDRVPVRGDVLTADPAVVATRDLLAVLHGPAARDRPPALATVSVGHARRPGWPPAPGSVATMHLGTARVEAHIARGPRAAADLGARGRVARIRLGAEIAAAVGDRFVLRRASPAGLVAGGIVLDATPPVGPSRRRITGDLLVALAGSRAGADTATGDGDAAAARLAMHGALPEQGGSWALAADVEAALREAIGQRVADAGPRGVPLAELRPWLIRELRRRVTIDERSAGAVVGSAIAELAVAGSVVREGEMVRSPGSVPAGPGPDVLGAMERLERALDVAAPPSLADAARAAGCPPEGVRALESAGRIVRLGDDLAYAAATFAALQATALRLAGARPLGPAELRDATGTSRKYVMAILEELDRRGVLQRTPDGHRPGPRAPR